MNPANADAYFNLGWAYVDMNHFKNATRQLEQALRLNPNHTGAQERLETAKRMMDQDSERLNGNSPATRRNRPPLRDPSQPVIIITP